MSTDSHFSRLQRKLREFCGAQKGNVALTFGVAAIPIVCAVGAAVDYTHAASVKAALQSALDATALMLQKEAAGDTHDQLEQHATTYFTALFTRPEAKNVAVDAVFSEEDGSHVQITASADVPTNFMGILGINSLHVSSSGTAKWGSTRLRVALVLDNTGSMAADGKIDALKTATTNLLGQLKAAGAEDGDVYVSIVPFSRGVNVGAYQSSWCTSPITGSVGGTSSCNWLDSDPPPNSIPPVTVGATGDPCPYTTSGNGFQCVTKPNGSSTTTTIPASITYAGVTYTGPICPGNSGSRTGAHITIGCYDSVHDASLDQPITTTKTVSSCSGLSNCTCTVSSGGDGGGGDGGGGKGGGGKGGGGGGSTTTCTQTITTTAPGYRHTWHAFLDQTDVWGNSAGYNCVMDRGGWTAPDSANYDQNLDSPDSSIEASLYPPDGSAACPPAAVMGLNADWDAMNTLVSNMTPNGNTNQPIGLVWGWLSLVGGGPLTVPAMDPNRKYAQIIILLSDGLNTQNRWSTSATAIDDRMYDPSDGSGTCKNIKDTGITIYTIQVDTGGDPTSTLLQNCASSSDKFFKLTSADEIVTTFNQIGTDITKLHLSQ